MTDFIPRPQVAPAPPADETIQNDGWWPDVSLAAVRASVRVDGGVTDARLREAVLAAILWVNAELGGWRIAREADGAVNLADVDASTVGGESRLLVLYRRAVFAAAKAETDEGYREPDTRYIGEVRGEALAPTIAAYRRNAALAIRDFLGLSRVTVDLI